LSGHNLRFFTLTPTLSHWADHVTHLTQGVKAAIDMAWLYVDNIFRRTRLIVYKKH
jgi:hypothetical protein